MNPPSADLLHDLAAELAAVRSDLAEQHVAVQLALAMLDEILSHMKALVSQR